MPNPKTNLAKSDTKQDTKSAFNHKSSMKMEMRENPKKYDKKPSSAKATGFRATKTTKSNTKTNLKSESNYSESATTFARANRSQSTKSDNGFKSSFVPKYSIKPAPRRNIDDILDRDESNFTPNSKAYKGKKPLVVRPAKDQYKKPDKTKLFSTDKLGVGEAMTNTTSWGSVASWYDKMISDKDSYQNQIILPKVLEILNLKSGQSVLDLGCGVGYFCQKYVENTSGISITGVDIGKESIAIATTKTDESIKYHTHSADSLPFIKDKSVDKITIILAIQNIQKADKTLAECGRVLKNGGQVVIVINHPYYRIPQNSSWVWSEDEFCQYRRVDKYLSSFEVSIDMNPSKTKGEKNITTSFHRPLEWFIQNLSKNNLLVSDLQEWVSHRIADQGPKKTPVLEASRKEIPLFMCLVATKK